MANQPTPAAPLRAVSPDGVLRPPFPQAAPKLDLAQTLIDEYEKNGPNPEYQAFAQLASYHISAGPVAIGKPNAAQGFTSFALIEDAYTGGGGFATGAYLDAFEGELQNPKPGSSAITPQARFQRRQRLADYDNFVRTICDTIAGYLIQSKDLVKRHTEDGSLAAKVLPKFWADMDGKGMEAVDFMMIPWKEARKFGTGVIIMDRPEIDDQRAADEDPANAPYCYVVPTRNVVHWRFDDDGDLTGLVIAEPQTNGDLRTARLRVWTEDVCAVWNPTKSEATTERGAGIVYVLDESSIHPNEIGVVPAVLLFDGEPETGQLLGNSEMWNVALLGKTVYNYDSMIRQTCERAGFPTLAIGMSDPTSVATVSYVAGGAFGFEKDGPVPVWLEPTLETVTKLRAERDAKVQEAYAMAHIAAVTGYVQTSSGFHSQAEFDRTNRRIGKAAAAIEAAEMKLGELALRWSKVGITDAEMDGTFTVAYPRDFGIRDRDAEINRAASLLSLNLGRNFNELAIDNLVTTFFPKLSPEERKAMVKQAADSADAATAANLAQGQTEKKTVRQRLFGQELGKTANVGVGQ